MEQAAGIVLLLIVVALVIQLIRAGPDGARAWIKAKFLGQTPGGATHTHGQAAGASASSAGGSIAGSVASSIKAAPFSPFGPLAGPLSKVFG